VVAAVNIYLILITLALPAPPGQPVPTLDLMRAVITASSLRACQVHADNLADLQRQQHADTVRRLGGRVQGTCYLQPAPAAAPASAASGATP
jgi:hypothetical protein